MLEQLRIYESKFPELFQAVFDELKNQYELVDMEYMSKLSKGTEKLIIELKKGNDSIIYKQFSWDGRKQEVTRYQIKSAA